MRDEDKTKEDLLHEIGQLREKVTDLERRLLVGDSPQEGFEKLGVGLIAQAGHSHYEADILGRLGGKSQTIPADLTSLFTKEITDSGSFDIRGDIWATTFSKVLQALPIPALLVDQLAVVFQTNQAWERVIQDSTSIIGKGFSDLFSHEYSGQEAQSLIETILTDRKTRVTKAWLKIDNVEIWARMTFRPIRIMNERFILILIEDLTTQSRRLLLNYEHEQELKKEIELRTKAEEALRESEEKYRLVVENAKEVIFVIQEGKIVFANAEGIKRSGYTEKGLINRSYLEFVHPDDRELVTERYMNRMDGLEIPEAYPIRILYQDGSIWWGYFNMLVIDWKGNPAVLVFGIDITELKKTEEHLRESEERFRSIFANSHAVMLIIDPGTGNIEDANPAASSFYRYTINQLTSMKVTDINTLTSEQVFKEMQQAKLQNRSYFNFRHRLANGDVRDVEVYSGPIVVQGQELLYSIIHDITERKHLEAELQKLATTDSLTGAYTRQHFMNKGQEEFIRSRRYKRPLSVLMIDIDHFKSINDTHGHHTGDLALKAMVKKCTTILRQTDILGRLGGEEFGAILTETNLDGALQTADRMRKDLELLSVPDTAVSIHITVSIGLTSIRSDDVSLENVLQRADKAMYEAKRRGRNSVVKVE